MANDYEYSIEMIFRVSARKRFRKWQDDIRYFEVKGMTDEQYQVVHRRIQAALSDVASSLLVDGYTMAYKGQPLIPDDVSG